MIPVIQQKLVVFQTINHCNMFQLGGGELVVYIYPQQIFFIWNFWTPQYNKSQGKLTGKYCNEFKYRKQQIFCLNHCTSTFNYRVDTVA